MVVAIVAQLNTPIKADATSSMVSFLLRAFTLSTLPFVPAGAFVALVLTKYGNVGRSYFYDLLGASMGCAALIPLLGWLGGPGCVLFAAAVSCLGTYLLIRDVRPVFSKFSFLAALLLVTASVHNSKSQWLRIQWWHDGKIEKPLYEKWNIFSRIMIQPRGFWPAGWGIQPKHLQNVKPVDSLTLDIDSGASTTLLNFKGDIAPFDYLTKDITAIGHYLRPNADVAIIGAGGGKDILTALAFHQKSVVGIEVNQNIVNAVENEFGDFTGHLGERGNVSLLADEGRSFLARTPLRFDIIQASLVDTWAATGAGAYAFTENGLYTWQAWRGFLQKLKPRGILSFSRWYYGSTNWPVEIYRLVGLATKALRESGISDPSKNILLIATTNIGNSEGLGTLLVSKTPFSDEDLETIKTVCNDLPCLVAYSSKESIDSNFQTIIQAKNSEDLKNLFPL